MTYETHLPGERQHRPHADGRGTQARQRTPRLRANPAAGIRRHRSLHSPRSPAYTPDAWLVEADTKIGYEVSFTRHFYQPPQLRTLAQISAAILAQEQETEGLLDELLKGKS